MNMNTMNTTTSPPTPETDAALVDHMPKDATEWSEHYLALCIHSRKLERERDEARDQLKAMREAITEVFNSFADEPASDSAWLLDDRQTAALAKLQPFIKP